MAETYRESAAHRSRDSHLHAPRGPPLAAYVPSHDDRTGAAPAPPAPAAAHRNPARIAQLPDLPLQLRQRLRPPRARTPRAWPHPGRDREGHGRRVGPQARRPAPAPWSWAVSPVRRRRPLAARGGRADRTCCNELEPRRVDVHPGCARTAATRSTTADGFDHNVVIRGATRWSPGAPAFDVNNQSPSRPRGRSSATTATTSACSRSRATASARCSWSTTSTPTSTSCSRPAATPITRSRRSRWINHGMSVVEIKRGQVPGSWFQVKNLSATTYNRRIHIRHRVRAWPARPRATTGCKTTADPTGTKVLGTLNNCAGGITPWGTVLSGEENFNQYFDKSGGRSTRATPRSTRRYGITGSRRPARVERTSTSASTSTTEPHEPHRFGWIVEVDPFEPDSTPVKHTMLGRFKHEGANIIVAEGRPGGRLHGRRRARRLHLQVRLDEQVRRAAARTLPARRTRRCSTRARSTSRSSPATAPTDGAVRRHRSSGSRCAPTPSRSSPACRSPRY